MMYNRRAVMIGCLDVFLRVVVLCVISAQEKYVPSPRHNRKVCFYVDSLRLTLTPLF